MTERKGVTCWYPLKEPPPLDAWLNGEIEAAVRAYIDSGFFFVQGDKVHFQSGDPLGVEKSDDLLDALIWDVDGFKGAGGKIDGDDPETIKARQKLAALRATLVEAIKQIDAAMPT